MTELHPALYDISDSVSSIIAKRYRAWVELRDVSQECFAWALSRNEQFTEWLNEPDAESRVINEKRIAYQMRRMAERYARKEKAAKSGYQTGDETFYETTTVAQLLPFVITAVVTNTVLEQAQEMVNDGQPKKKSVPSEGGNLLAILIDIKKAYLKLEVEDAKVLELRYYENFTLQQIASYLECAVSSADRRCTSALRKLVNILGGDNPWS